MVAYTKSNDIIYYHNSFPINPKNIQTRRKILDLRRVLWYNIIPLNEELQLNRC